MVSGERESPQENYFHVHNNLISDKKRKTNQLERAIWLFPSKIQILNDRWAFDDLRKLQKLALRVRLINSYETEILGNPRFLLSLRFCGTSCFASDDFVNMFVTNFWMLTKVGKLLCTRWIKVTIKYARCILQIFLSVHKEVCGNTSILVEIISWYSKQQQVTLSLLGDELLFISKVAVKEWRRVKSLKIKKDEIPCV